MINQNVEIWNWLWESNKILKFERKRADLSNVEIYCKGGYQTKFWNLGVKGELKMLEFKWKIRKSIKMLKFGCKGEIDQIWMPNVKSIKMLKFERKTGDWCWYFTAKVEINQNIGIWLKNKELIRILKFKDNVGNRS